MFTSSFKMLNDFVYKQCLEKALDLDNTCFNFKDNFLIEVKESVILLRDSAWRPLLFNSGIIPSSYGQKFMFCPFSIKSPNQLVVDFLQKCTDSKVCFVSAREGLKLPKRALRPLSNTDVSSYLKRILNNEPRKNGVTNTFYYSSEYEFSLGVSNEDAAAAEEKCLHFDGRCVFRVTHMNTFTLVRVAPSPVIKGLDLALSVFSNSKKVRPALSISHCERNRNRFGVRCGLWEEKLIILEHENHFVVSAYDSLKLNVKNINKLDEHLSEFEEKFEFCAFCFATNLKGRFRVAVAPLKRGDARTALLTCGKNEISVIAVYDTHKELEELLNHHYELSRVKEEFIKFYADALLCKHALCPGFKDLIRKKGKEIANICIDKINESREETKEAIEKPVLVDKDEEIAQAKYTEELLDAKKRAEARREKEKAAAMPPPPPRTPSIAPPRRGKELSSEASKRAGKAAFELDKPLRTAIWEKNREAERAEAAARRAAARHEETKKRRLAKELPSLEEEFARPAPDLDLMTWRGDVQSLAEARLDLTSARNGEDDDGEGTVADDGVASVAATEDIEISRHALERMMERGVRPEELTNTLREPRIIENRGGARKLIGNEGVTAIVATEGNVITAYRLRTEQR